MKTITFDLETVYSEEFEGKDEFAPLPTHVPVVGSFLRCDEDEIEMITFSADQGDDYESNMIDWLQSELKSSGKPYIRLITWNGMKFDVPLLLIRAMVLGLDLSGMQAYRHRYHDTHFDMKFRIANGETRNYSMDQMAKALGLTGKHVCSGGDVQQLWKYQHDYSQVRRYCEEDVLQTYMIYLKWMKTFQGAKTDNRYERLVEMLNERLRADLEAAKERIRCGKSIESATRGSSSES